MAARRYEVEVVIPGKPTKPLYVELVSTLGEEAAIRRAITVVAVREDRSGNRVPPPSSREWEGKVIADLPA